MSISANVRLNGTNNIKQTCVPCANPLSVCPPASTYPSSPLTPHTSVRLWMAVIPAAAAARRASSPTDTTASPRTVSPGMTTETCLWVPARPTYPTRRTWSGESSTGWVFPDGYLHLYISKVHKCILSHISRKATNKHVSMTLNAEWSYSDTQTDLPSTSNTFYRDEVILSAKCFPAHVKQVSELQILNVWHLLC